MKYLSAIVSFVICILSTFSLDYGSASVATDTLRVVIDPGHGGMDSGCNIGDIEEEEINLNIAFYLKDILLANGVDVVMTRENNEALCEDKFIKKEDMNNRLNIINSSNADMLISIHLNMFSSPFYHGAQTFYSKVNEKSKMLAENVQASIKTLLKNTDRVPQKRDNIYILNRVSIPAIIVECGFLSNEEERSNLIDSDYQYAMAYSIFLGCMK